MFIVKWNPHCFTTEAILVLTVQYNKWICSEYPNLAFILSKQSSGDLIGGYVSAYLFFTRKDVEWREKRPNGSGMSTDT